jgi:2-polyprenyl-3-methyl-5-hydroxy-6-metoxy-1,4-benzoquinol methylase
MWTIFGVMSLLNVKTYARIRKKIVRGVKNKLANVTKEASKVLKPKASEKTSAALFDLQGVEFTANEKPYLKAGNARAIEKKWQDFLNRKPTYTTKLYSQIRPAGAIEEIIPCMLCGSKSFKHIMTPAKKDWSYDVVKCTDCDLMFRNPNIIPEHLHLLYDQVNYNDFLTSKYGGSTRQAKYKSVLLSFSDLIPEKGPLKVLDFGCGNGLFLEIAKDRGYEGWGIDLSPESIEHAKTLLGHNRLYCGDLDKIPELENEKFDLITLWSVLAHLPRPIDTFSMIRKFLKPGGALLVFTVNPESLLLKTQHEKWNGFTRNHLAFFSAQSAKMLFRKSGFKQFYSRPHYANVQSTMRNKLTPEQWDIYKTNVLESGGGNMNRFLAFN